MSEASRRQEVAESSCQTPGCSTCARYIETGDVTFRPNSRPEYMANLRRSYPVGVPDRLIPAWARGEVAA